MHSRHSLDSMENFDGEEKIALQAVQPFSNVFWQSKQRAFVSLDFSCMQHDKKRSANFMMIYLYLVIQVCSTGPATLWDSDGFDAFTSWGLINFDAGTAASPLEAVVQGAIIMVRLPNKS